MAYKTGTAAQSVAAACAAEHAAHASFEQMPANAGSLTFKDLAHRLAAAGLPFNREQMESLGLQTDDGSLTNLGLMLSDQCPFSFQIAPFLGTDACVVQNWKVLEGSLLSQLDQMLAFLESENGFTSCVAHSCCMQLRNYPDDALREAASNMVLHRDYRSSVESAIHVFSNRIEFISAGGLVPDVLPDEVQEGISACRNPRLAHALAMLGMANGLGIGMQRIAAAYAGQKSLPYIKITPASFVLVLPNLGYARSHSVTDCVEPESAIPLDGAHRAWQRIPAPRTEHRSDAYRLIMNLARSNKSITRRQTEEALGISKSSAHRLLQELVQDGRLRSMGASQSCAYSAAT